MRSYETVYERESDLESVYTALASLLGCQPTEVAILSSATAAWQAVVYGLAWQWRPGDRLLTSVAEYGRWRGLGSGAGRRIGGGGAEDCMTVIASVGCLWTGPSPSLEPPAQVHP